MRTDSSLVAVGDTIYRWSIHREPQWCTADGWKGLALMVEAIDKSGRQLIIELPFQAKSHRSTPHRQRPVVARADVELYIREAMESGWDTDSRGKPFVFEPKATSNTSLERTRDG
jgi:hypothetical protein